MQCQDMPHAWLPERIEDLRDWIDELELARRRKRSPARSFTDEQKPNAVVKLQSKEKSATQIAAELGVERATL